MSGINNYRNRVGPVFALGYLGSALLANGKTGLGCLQQPLRELYSLYRQYGFRLLQDRRLIISLEGITMLYNEVGIEKYLHNDLTSVYDAQLLKFCCERKRDKKVYGAFLPVGEEFDSKYANLFSPVEKQYSDAFDSLHPAIITLIMRRATGIQALECHVFVCRSINEAKNIVDRIHEVCDLHKSNINQKANLFQYKPYMDVPLKKSERSVGHKSNNDFNYVKAPNVISNNLNRSEIKTDGHKRSKSVASMNSRSSTSLFSKIKANFMDKSKSSKGPTNGDENEKLKRDINRISIKSEPERKPSELTLMMNKRQNHFNNENIFIKSSTSIASSNHSINNEANYKKKEKKFSLGKKFLLSSRSNNKPGHSSKSSVSSSKKSSKIKCSSASSLADVDFRKPKSIFDKNLLIDGSIPSLPPSRSVSPKSFRPKSVNISENGYLSSSYKSIVDTPIIKSDKIGKQNTNNNLFQKNQNLKQFTKETSNKENQKKHLPVSSSKQQYLNSFQINNNILAKSLSNMSQSTEFKEFSQSNESFNSEELEFKSPQKHPELLSNHLVWNPNRKAPECIDSISIGSSSSIFPLPSRKYIETDFTKINTINQNSRTSILDNSLSLERKNNLFSSGLSTTPISEISEISNNKIKFKDSAYNTNSSNEYPEIQDTLRKPASAFSYVSNNIRENTYISKDINPDVNKIPDLIPYQKIEDNRTENKYNNSKINSHKQIIGGVKVFPSMPSEYNNGPRYIQKDSFNPNYPRDGFRNQFTNEQQIPISKANSNLLFHNFKGHDQDDNEIIDLTKLNDIRRNSTINSTKVVERNLIKPTSSYISNSNSNVNRNYIHNEDQSIKNSLTQRRIYNHNEHFGGY